MGIYYNKPLIGSAINFANPITNGLEGCWLFNACSGPVVPNLVHGQPAIVLSGIGTTRTEWRGDGVYFSGQSESYGTAGDNYDIGLSDFTVVTSITPTQYNTAGSGYYISKAEATSADYRWAVGYAQNTGVVRMFAGDFGAGEIVFNGTKVLDLNVKNSVACRWRRTSYASIFVNGSFDTSSDISTYSSSNLQSTMTFKVGLYHIGSTTNCFFGSVHYIYVYRRALTDEEIRTIHIDPYCIFDRGLVANDYEAATANLSIHQSECVGNEANFG